MYLLTAAEMRAVDAATVAAGTPVATLMTRAGEAVAEALERRFGTPLALRVLVLCGGGHNAGDGLVSARALAARGAHVAVALCTSEAKLAPLTRDMLAALDGTRVFVQPVTNASELAALAATLDAWDFVIDALLGTGAEGEPRGVFADACGLANALRAQGARVVAVDMPTGVSSDDGTASDDAVQADLTITFGEARRGHWLWPGRANRGVLEVADIGLVEPRAAGLAPAELGHARALAPDVPVRDPRAHKGSAGRALIVGGAPGMTGALVLAARAAVRSGAGYVRVAAPASLQSVLASHLVEPMVIACGEDDQRTLTASALARILDEASRADAVSIGSGLSTRPHAAALVRELATHLDKPLVLDADALTALSPADSVLVPALKLAPAPRILTPHLGEMQRLSGQSPAELEARRIDAARGWAQRWGATIVLKGAPTVIASPDGHVTVNPTGNAALATAGTGDVLTGILVALLAQGLAPYDAARLAVHVHGLAGDTLAQARGGIGMAASDLIDGLPAALQTVRSAR
ncbi:MAG: NAD(P)H-hydrate dehydratase [Candidatus Eisenbacteria bacterium]|nr:NAD(P)H-hydrate dehydratase [Candidatus Eisenbacteria bacterium]